MIDSWHGDNKGQITLIERLVLSPVASGVLLVLGAYFTFGDLVRLALYFLR